MNICFYTSERPTAASRLNIHHLVQSRPDHNYSFLNVAAKPQPTTSLTARLKRTYAELRFDDGRFDFERDLATIDKRLEAVIAPLDKTKFRSGIADVVNDDKSVQFLKEVKPDIIIQAGAGILKPNTFGLAGKGTINVHHGLSPEIRGIESTFWCLFYGVKDKIGVTCHFIDETLDTGAVIKQQALNSAATTFIDLQFENYLLGRDVLVQSIDILDKGGYGIKSAGAVPSYYFGMANPFLYYALKKRNFTPQLKLADKAFKMKEKKYLEL